MQGVGNQLGKCPTAHAMVTEVCSRNPCKKALTKHLGKGLGQDTDSLPQICVCVTHREIALVAYQHDGHVGVCMLPSIIQPAC